MRVRVTFKVKNRGASIPFHHQHLISSFIKEKLKDGGENGLSDFSLYSFSGVKGLPESADKVYTTIQNEFL